MALGRVASDQGHAAGSRRRKAERQKGRHTRLPPIAAEVTNQKSGCCVPSSAGGPLKARLCISISGPLPPATNQTRTVHIARPITCSARPDCNDKGPRWRQRAFLEKRCDIHQCSHDYFSVEYSVHSTLPSPLDVLESRSRNPQQS